jgi:hypothetical protein
MDSDFIHDKFVDDLVIEYDETAGLWTEVSSDLASSLAQGLGEACHNGNDIAGLAGTTTDGQGRVYNLVDTRANDFVFGRKKALFSSTIEPSKISEAIVYQDLDTGKVFLNNFIRTADFAKQQAQRVMPDTCSGIVMSLQVMKSGSAVNDSILNNINRLITDPQGTIVDAVDCLAEESGVTTSSTTVYDILSEVWTKYNSELYPLPVGKGSVQSLWQVIKDNYESSMLNDYIQRACDILLSGQQKAETVTSLVVEATQSKYKSVVRFGKGISASFSRGGIYGAACYIIAYVKELMSAEDNDGTFHFTDNSRYAPQVYLAGVISAVITTAGALLMMLGMIFGKIAGAALAIIGSIMTSVVKAFQYDYSSTNAAVNTAEDVIIPACPFAMYKGSALVSAFDLNDDIAALLGQGETLLYAEIPGGFVLMGPGSFDDSGKVTSINYECHPSVADGRAACELVANFAHLHVLSFTLQVPSESMWLITPHIRHSGTEAGRSDANIIASFWDRAVSNNTLANQSNDRLSNNDDLKLRQILACNMFIMGLYIALIGGSDLMEVTGYNTIYVSASTGQGDHKIGHTLVRDNTLGHGCTGLWSYFAYVGSANTYERFIVGDVTYDVYFNGHDAQGDYYFDEDWSWIVSQMVEPFEIIYDGGVQASPAYALLNYCMYYNELVVYPNSMTYAIYTPQYDKKSFWSVIIGTLVIATLVTVAVTIATVKVKRAIAAKRAVNEAKIAQAYDNLQHDPSKENYDAYRKAVKKNNLWANVIGGSKFDLESYWHGSTNQSAGQTSGSIDNPFRLPTLFGVSEVNTGEDVAAMDTSMSAEYNTARNGEIIQSTDDISSDVGRIALLITG